MQYMYKHIIIVLYIIMYTVWHRDMARTSLYYTVWSVKANRFDQVDKCLRTIGTKL